MNSTGWLLLIGGGLLVYLLISKSGVTYSANPLQNVLPQPPTTPPPAGQQWQWNGFQWLTVPMGATAL